MSKYGVDNFKIELIDTANTQEELDYKEKYYIKEYNTLCPNGYNLTEGGIRGKHLRGGQRTPEIQSKISKAVSLALSKPVAQYDKNGKLIKIFKNAREAEQSFNSKSSHICEVCKGKRKTAHEYVWKYVDKEMLI